MGKKKAYIALAALLMGAMWNMNIVRGDGNAVIPLKQTFTIVNNPDGTGIDQTITYTLTAAVSTDPMPAGSTAGTYTFTVSGNQTLTIGGITGYTVPGVYRYKLKQNDGGKAYYSYDKTEYEVIVNVINDPSMPGRLKSQVAIRKNGVKVPMATFTVKYDKPSPKPKGSTEKVAKTQDNTNLALWSTAFGVSLSVIIVRILWMAKENRKEA